MTLKAKAGAIALVIAGTAWAFAASASFDGEAVPKGEARAVEEVKTMIADGVRAGYEKNGHAFRDAHRKHHGCVKADFQVLPNLPENLARGVFQTERRFPAWIRFSNGSGSSQDDRVGDGRGMAIKLMDVPGAKLLADESETQDFLMINHPVFFVRNAEEYVKFQKAAMSGQIWKFFLMPHRFFHEAKIAKTIQGKTVTNLLNTQYFSMTPSKLGTDQEMKFSVRPCSTQAATDVSVGPERLRENLEAHLTTQNACFEFMVQLRTDPKKMPIEDATIEWSEKVSAFVPVARIVIPAQAPEQGEFCEALSFNPWHSVEAHRPMGGISRVRKAVYEEISRLRHELNGQPHVEPRADW